MVEGREGKIGEADDGDEQKWELDQTTRRLVIVTFGCSSSKHHSDNTLYT